MRTISAILLAVVVLHPLTAKAVQGDVWGTWPGPDTVYVTGEIRVPPESTLVIEPAVLVVFEGHYKFVVDSGATLIAVGTKSDPISFIPLIPNIGWHGIRFLQSDSLSQLAYCRLEYGKSIGEGDDSHGGAILLDSCSPTIRHCTIRECRAEDKGGAIYCRSCDPIIESVRIIANSASDGGAVYCSASNPLISNSVLNENVADLTAGAIYCYQSSPTISSNQIRENRAGSQGGGVFCNNSSNPTISGNTITGNVASNGGGIGCYRSAPTIEGNQIESNAAGNEGGGVLCYDCSSSNLTIAANTITGNSAQYDGGGIYCSSSRPTISNNTIIGNSAQDEGGGIFCSSSSPAISDNTISENVCGGYASTGGGIFCFNYSDPTIADNILVANSADSHGGAIVCEAWCDPEIRGNTISRNSSGQSGGGIYCGGHSEPTVSNNMICVNSAEAQGGGFYCYNSNPTIISNTSYRNSAGGAGGGIFCSSSSPVVANTILWEDSASSGSEICVIGSGGPSVTYCDVQGGWQGQGNINADPLFVGPEREDFSLRWRSPCIDAGDPDFPLDPDFTRSDIGALYFNQYTFGIVELFPHDTPIMIPPEGGQLSYDAWIYNFTVFPLTVDIWSYVFVPGIGQYGPIHHHSGATISPMDSIGVNGKRNRVAGPAPAGGYTLVAYIGDFLSSTIDSSHFYFTKTGAVGAALTRWFEGEGWFKEASQEPSNLPAGFALCQNYPNPFNPTTTFEYALPKRSHVKLEVFNLLGQKAVTLVDEAQDPGYRTFNWKTSNLASGIYFYRLTAGDFSETRRMMLVK